MNLQLAEQMRENLGTFTPALRGSELIRAVPSPRGPKKRPHRESSPDTPTRGSDERRAVTCQSRLKKPLSKLELDIKR